MIQLTISDTGVGIAASDLPHVFERFYRASNSPDRGPGGGLGLAIVKRIVERHNGSVAIQSELDKGTSVIVRFPQADTVLG